MEGTQPIDPEIAAALASLPTLVLDDAVVRELRSTPAAGPSPPPAGVHRTDHVVPATPDVHVRVHQPTGPAGARPAVVSMHGGGLVLGSHEDDDALFDAWCPSLGVVGVAVDYRLAPDARYPAPLEDCYAALRWTFDHADELGVDRERIGVRGISAGGGLAAALTLLARERGEVAIAFQLLDCPMLDDRQTTPSSRQDDLLVWSRESNAFGWRSYLGDLYATDAVPSTAAPARETDLAGLPPAFVSVGSIDGFRDEDVDYALRLNQAGVPCELHVYPGAPHGYHLVATAAVTERSRRDASSWLARQVGGPGSSSG